MDKVNSMDVDVDENTNSSQIDEKDIFIKSAVENVMSIYWPAPSTDFYCRVCNYLEFGGEGPLRKHQETDDHKKRMANESISFCLICQMNTYNKELLEKHRKGKRHQMLKDIFNEAEIKAEKFWNEKIATSDAELLNTEDSSIAEISPKEQKILQEEKSVVSENILQKNSKPKEESSEYQENMRTNYELLKDDYAEDIINLKADLEKFFDSKFRYTGNVQCSFTQMAVKDCMKSAYDPVSTGNHCVACNFVTFENQKEREDHFNTESHALHVEAKRYYYCNLCKFNYLNDMSYEEHFQKERHKKLLCLLYAAKMEAISLSKSMKVQNKTYMMLVDMFYPQDGFIQDNTFCFTCTKNIKVSAEEHVKSNKQHLRNFNRYVDSLQPYVLEDGCPMCRITKEDDPNFSVKKHKNSKPHKMKYKAYVNSGGLVYPSGIAGTISGGKFKK